MLGFIGAFYVILAVVLILYEQAIKAGYDALQKVLRLLLYWLAPLYCLGSVLYLLGSLESEAFAGFVCIIVPFSLIFFVISEYFIVKRFMRKIENQEKTFFMLGRVSFSLIILICFYLLIIFA